MTDKEIIELYWHRQEQAIAETDTAYGRRLRGLSNRILNNREDASEMVNDTYMKAWETIPSNRPQFFYAYLAAICRHFSLNLVDWNQAAKRNAEIVSITEEMDQCIPDPEQDKILRGKELAEALNAFLGTLPKETRLLFLRRYWYADSVAAIAKRYGMTESKVKMQLLRTRGKLKDYLEREGFSV